MSLAVKRFSFLIIMSKKKINIKENFTYMKKNPQDQVTFKWKPIMKNDPRKAI